MKHIITRGQRKLAASRAVAPRDAACITVGNDLLDASYSITVSREDAVELAGVLLMLAGME